MLPPDGWRREARLYSPASDKTNGRPASGPLSRGTRKLKTAQSPLGTSLLWMGEVGFGRGLILHGCHFVGIDADDQIADMIVNPCELVADARRDDDRVARFEVVRDAVADRGPIAARTVQVAHIIVRGRAALDTEDVGTGDKRGFAVDNVVDLAHEVVLGDGRSSDELRAINHADIDVALANIDRAHLLIGDAGGGGELGGAVEIGVQLGG